MKSRAIVFDFFGVFCKEVARYWYAKQTIDEPYESLRARIIAPYDRGTLSAEEAYAQLGAVAGVSGEEVHREWLAHAVVDQDIIALVQSLTPRYTTALCTNASAAFLKEILPMHELRSLFSTVIISSEEGVCKPEPELYQITLTRLGCNAEESIFIDDRPENVAAARALGMQGIVYKDLQALKEELARLGVR